MLGECQEEDTHMRRQVRVFFLAASLTLGVVAPAVETAAASSCDRRVGVMPIDAARRRAPVDNCGYWTFAIGTYEDGSEVEFLVSFCSPSGKVKGCSVKPDCYNGENPPVVTMGPGETATSFFGFSPWAGYTPCQA